MFPGCRASLPLHVMLPVEHDQKGEISVLLQGVSCPLPPNLYWAAWKIRPGTASSPTSDGDTSQGLVVADFVVSVLMFPDAIVDFFAVNTQVIRNLEAELDLSSLYAEDTDADIVANMDTFSCAAIQYLHTVSPC